MSELFTQSELVSRLRATGGGKGLVIETIKFVFVILVADAVTTRWASFVINHGIEPLASMPGIWLIAIGTLSFAALAYLAMWENLSPRYAGVCVKPWKRSLAELALGYLIGAVIMSVAVIATTLLGGFELTSNLGEARVGSVGIMVPIFLFQAFGEEVLYRGTGMTCMARKNSPVAAILVSSVLFSLHHHFNQGYGPLAFVNLFLLAVLLGISVFVTNRIWMATAIHAAWNFFQGNVFGVNVSGGAQEPASRLISCTTRDMPIVTGGQMGLEGSLVTTAALVLSLLLCVWFLRSRSNKRAKLPQA